jgi:hypothetical protein
LHVETGASDFALRSILSQKDSAKMLHSIAFYLQKFMSAEINYKIYDKELLAVIDSFKVWRYYLEIVLYTTMVFKVHQNLEYFITTKVLNQRQGCWA